MIDLVLRFILPAAYSVLPAEMRSAQASAMLLTIGLQESKFEARYQAKGGPARSFWQFERQTVRAVLQHDETRDAMARVLQALRYERDSPVLVHETMAHNDILAACVARCLLWTDPRPLPLMTEPALGWRIYEGVWRPGKPHPELWRDHFAVAWNQLQRPVEGLRA